MSITVYKRSLAPFLLLFVLLTTTGASAVIDESVLGKTFNVTGPNCFAAALRVTGLYHTFRGVGPQEFHAFTQLACEKVDTPVKGDIGTYYLPEYSYSHAYVHVDSEFGIDKPGVDYMGQTAVEKKRLASIDFIHYASKECRQYSHDITLCANTRAHYRCKKLDWSNYPEIIKHQHSIEQWEQQLSIALESSLPMMELKAIESELREKMVELEAQSKTIEALPLDLKIKNYVSSRMRSLRDQMTFLSLKTDSH